MTALGERGRRVFENRRAQERRGQANRGENGDGFKNQYAGRRGQKRRGVSVLDLASGDESDGALMRGRSSIRVKARVPFRGSRQTKSEEEGRSQTSGNPAAQDELLVHGEPDVFIAIQGGQDFCANCF